MKDEGRMGAKKASKDSRKAHGAAKKGDVFYIDPEKLTLVTDPNSDAYDRRVHDEPEEKFILNVMHYGVQDPITVRKNPESGETEVLKGRTRTKALRIANKRLIARGDEPHLMPCLVKRAAKGALALALIVIENEQRRADTATNRAEKAARMKDRGASDEEIGLAFGMEVAQVRNLLALHDAPAFIRHAVDAEKVTLTNGIKAAKVASKEGPDAGRKLIEKLIEHAPRTPGKKRSANSRKAREIVDGVPVMQPKKNIVDLRDRLQALMESGDANFESVENISLMIGLLKWVLGEVGGDASDVVAAATAAAQVHMRTVGAG
jgi:ParB family chromosome partitioning protein